MNQQALDEKCFTFGDDAAMKLKKKIEEKGTRLKEWDVKIYRGVVTGFNKAFIINDDTKKHLCKEDPKSAEVIKPILRGRDIHRYYYEWKGLWLIFTRRGFDIGKYPAIKNHLSKYKKQLEPRPPDWNEKENGRWEGRKPGPYKWYEIQDNIAYYPEFEKEKVVYPNMTKFLPFIYDERKFYTNQKCYILTSSQSESRFLKYLVAILNSAMGGWLIRIIFPELQGGTREINENIFINFPIPKIPDKSQQPFITLVDQILAAKQKDPNTDTSTLERQIDKMVYELYELTPNEIAIVEGK
jgi:hypothetical protein